MHVAQSCSTDKPKGRRETWINPKCSDELGRKAYGGCQAGTLKWIDAQKCDIEEPMGRREIR